MGGIFLFECSTPLGSRGWEGFYLPRVSPVATNMLPLREFYGSCKYFCKYFFNFELLFEEEAGNTGERPASNKITNDGKISCSRPQL